MRAVPSMTILMLLSLTAGCGKPSSQQGGPMGAMPITAVVAPVVCQPIDDAVHVVGTITARDEVSLLSELSSTIVEVCVADGQYVKKGEKLFVLDDTQTSANLLRAEADNTLARLSFERGTELLKSKTISQEEFDQAQATLHTTEAVLTMAKYLHNRGIVSAPFDGTVGEHKVSVGQYVAPGILLMQLVRTDPLDMAADIPERFAGQLTEGMAVSCVADAYPQQPIKGSVSYISPTVQENTRTIRIKAQIPNQEHTLKPGMFGKLHLHLGSNADGLVVPEAAVHRQGTSSLVVRVDTNGCAQFAQVKTGRRSKGSVEITEGLTSNDLVIVEGWQKTGPGSPIIAAPESARYGVTPGPMGSPSPTPPADTGEGE